MLPLEELRARALHQLREARAMQASAVATKEEARQVRLRLWLTRLCELRRDGGLEAGLQRALDAALSISTADCANIQLVPRSGRGLVLTAQRGFRQPFLDFFEFVDDGHTACGLALLGRHPVAVADISRSPIFARTRGLDVMLEAGVRAVASTPLLGRGDQVLGILSVHYCQPHRSTASELTRFQALAAAVTAAVVDGNSPVDAAVRRTLPLLRAAVLESVRR